MLNIKQVLDERIAEEVLPVLTYPEFKYISDDALFLNFTPGQLYITHTNPSLSVATGSGLTKGTQGKEGTFTVTTTDSTGQATYSEIDNVRVDIKSSQRGIEDIRSVVKDLKNGHYSISYTPKVAGNFSVSIKVRDEPIKGSPFTLVVTKNNSILKPGAPPKLAPQLWVFVRECQEPRPGTSTGTNGNKITLYSIYTLSDLGFSSNLIGSLSRANEHFSPPSE